MTSTLPARVAKTRYVQLTTFRKTGVPVSTPVWIAPESDADTVLVLTASGTGKVKRLRNNPSVELRPSDPLGRVPGGARSVLGTVVEIVEDEDEVAALRYDFLDKYGLEYRIFRFLERFGGDHGPDVILRIRLD